MDKPIPEGVVNAACEAAWPEFRSHLEGQQAWIDADPLRQNRLRLIVIQALTAAQQQGKPVPPSATVWVEGRYHPCTHILIDGLKRLEGGTAVLAEWDRARAQADAALAQQPAAVDGAVGTVTRVGSFEVLEHRIELDPEFDERLNNMPEGTVVRLYAAPVRDLTQKQLADAAAALATQHQEPTT